MGKQNKEIEKNKPKIGLGFELKKKFFKWVKLNPKHTFFGMVCLTMFSVLLTVISYYKHINIELPDIEKNVNFGVYDEKLNGIGGKMQESFNDGQDVLEMNSVLKELKAFKTKEVLTKGDSLRIIYLIGKYKIKE